MFEAYEAALAPIRGSFEKEVKTYFKADPVFLGKFMLNQFSLGVHMTEFVPDWVRRAGEKCETLGLTKLGRALVNHAEHEAGHHLLYIDDTKNLADYLKQNFGLDVEVATYLGQPITPGVQVYIDLHEDCIASDAPYGQIAIEYEIERLPVLLVPTFMKFAASVLGAEVLKSLSFVNEHYIVDIGHTKYNQEALKAFLVEKPDALNPLIEFGTKALQAYGNYLKDCARLANM